MAEEDFEGESIDDGGPTPFFSREHTIWQWADYHDHLDDYLDYAEDLIRRWAAQNSDEIKFGSTFNIHIASLLLIDNLLPASARQAFAELMLDVISEASANKLKIDVLKIKPPPPGRKKNSRELFFRVWEVQQHLANGLKKEDAYKLVAEKHHAAPVTIRREYERAMKKAKERR